MTGMAGVPNDVLPCAATTVGVLLDHDAIIGGMQDGLSGCEEIVDFSLTPPNRFISKPTWTMLKQICQEAE